MNMRKSLFFLLAALMPALAFSQVDYKWEIVKIDSTFDNGKDYSVVKIIEKYNSLMEPFQEIIGYTDEVYKSHSPESPLSNFAADAIRACAAELSGHDIDVALTNFGGIRSSLPRGAVRVYDIYSIFPFNNDIVCFDIKGSDLRAIFEKMAASGRIQAWSNVKLVVKERKVVRLEVAGKPLDDAKLYRMASINFLMDGGDNLNLSRVAQNLWESDVYLRDAFVEYIRKKTALGEKLVMSSDGRVQIIENEK